MAKNPFDPIKAANVMASASVKKMKKAKKPAEGSPAEEAMESPAKEAAESGKKPNPFKKK